MGSMEGSTTKPPRDMSCAEWRATTATSTKTGGTSSCIAPSTRAPTPGAAAADAAVIAWISCRRRLKWHTTRGNARERASSRTSDHRAWTSDHVLMVTQTDRTPKFWKFGDRTTTDHPRRGGHTDELK